MSLKPKVQNKVQVKILFHQRQFDQRLLRLLDKISDLRLLESFIRLEERMDSNSNSFNHSSYNCSSPDSETNSNPELLTNSTLLEDQIRQSNNQVIYIVIKNFDAVCNVFYLARLEPSSCMECQLSL